MKINPINNASFGRFRVTEQGADVIARNFMQNPETEEYFIDKIIKPLENCSVDVVHNGYSQLYKGSDDKYYLIQYASATGNEAVVTPTSGKTAYVRSVYYLPPNKKYAPRKYPDIEMARDIAKYFNKKYGYTLVVPQEKIQEKTATLVGLDGRKMSKSYGNQIPLVLLEANYQS